MEIKEDYKEDGDALNKKLKSYLSETSELKKKEKDMLVLANEFYNGSEWKDGAGSHLKDNERISFKLGRNAVETGIGAIYADPFEVEVNADELPNFPHDHPFSLEMQQYADQILVQSSDNAKIVGELLTHAMGTLRKNLKIDDKSQLCTRYSLVQGVCYLKDDVSIYEHDTLRVTLVPRSEIVKDPNATSWEEIQWLCHKIPMTKEELYDLEFFEEGELDDDQAAEEDETRVRNADYKDSINTKNHILEEWWLRDYSTQQDEETGTLVPKYAGMWKRVYRCKNKIRAIEANPYFHQRLPFHPLVLDPKLHSTDGASYLFDTLRGSIQGINKSQSLALKNMEKTADNKIVVSPDSVENPNDLIRPGTSVVIAKAGANLTDVIREIGGAPLSPAFPQMAQTFEVKFDQVAGLQQMAPPGSQPSGATSVQKNGYRIGMFRERVTNQLESLYYNLIMNLIGFVDEDKAFKLMGGIAPVSYVRFNPHIFQEMIDNFEARFSINIIDEEVLPNDPEKKTELMMKMFEVASIVAERGQLPIDEAISILPTMPMRGELSRKLLYSRMQREQAEANQPPQPTEAEEMATRARKEAMAEVAKQTLYGMIKQDPMLVADMITSGKAEAFIAIAQGDAPTPQSSFDGFLHGGQAPEEQLTEEEMMQLEQEARREEEERNL